jgi:hypothetical protein
MEPGISIKSIQIINLRGVSLRLLVVWLLIIMTVESIDDLLLIVNSIRQPPKLLLIVDIPLLLVPRLVLLLLLVHLQLGTSSVDPTLDVLNLLAHLCEPSLHLLLHHQNLLGYQLGCLVCLGLGASGLLTLVLLLLLGRVLGERTNREMRHRLLGVHISLLLNLSLNLLLLLLFSHWLGLGLS